MGKIALVFPGQGSQFVGMGFATYKQFKSAQVVFDQADAFNSGILDLCFKGPIEKLNQTKNTQACLFTTELALVAALDEMTVKYEGLAGFSLGEVTGLVVSNILSLEEGLDLVLKRGHAIERAAKESDSMMIAILKLKNSKVEGLCQNFSRAYPVNYNCPGQVVVSLLRRDQNAFIQAVKEAGGRGVALNVSGGFHSPFMSPTTTIFYKAIQELNFNPPRIPLYSNTNALPYPKNSDDIINQITYHINHPVYWEKTIRNMINDGFDQFIEVGPGKTLSGFIKKIDPYVHCSQAVDLLKHLKQ